VSIKFRGPEDVVSSVLREIDNRIRLRVMILGPGKEGGKIYEKRCEIRERIKSLGHVADFCEDVWKPRVLASSGLNLAVAEFLQARAYDYIVCLMDSPGAIGEVHDFARDKKIAHKMLICLDKKHKKGYSAQGVIRIFEGRNGKMDWFKNPTDLTSCHLAGRVTTQIKKLAEAEQWELAVKEELS